MYKNRFLFKIVICEPIWRIFFFESFDLQRWPQQVGHKNSVFADLNHSSSPGRDDVNDGDGIAAALHTDTVCLVYSKWCVRLYQKRAGSWPSQPKHLALAELNENFAWNERFTCLKEKNSLQTTLCSSSKMHLKDASLE